MRDEFFTARGIAYRVNRFVPGRRTLLFIHGLSGSCSAWKRYEEIFIGRYNIITFDLRGHGKSKRWRHFKDYEITEFRDDVIALLAHLQVEKTALIGHSFGTLVALAVSKERPALVEALIVLGVNYKVHALTRVHLSYPFLVAAAFILQYLPFIRTDGTRVHYVRYQSSGDYSPFRITADVRNTGLHPYLWTMLHLNRFTRDMEWEEVAAPFAILHGKYDHMVPLSFAKELARVHKGAKLVILNDMNHTSYMLQPEKSQKVAAAIQLFLTETENNTGHPILSNQVPGFITSIAP